MVAYVYIMASRRNGTLYIGVTSDLVRRVYEHREGFVDGFSKRYGTNLLVHFETYDDITRAIQRERTMKHWSRAWKLELIESRNPDWDDLYGSLLG
jgi:putative endonuclease